MEPYAWRRIYTFRIRQPTSQHPVGSSLVIPKSPQMQSGREDTLEERYTIKFSYKLGKMQQKRMEVFKLLFNHLA